jgi:hypothetical protein
MILVSPSSYPYSNIVLQLFALRTGLNYVYSHERDLKFEENNSFYVMDQEMAINFLKKIDFEKDVLILINNFYVLLPNWVLCKTCTKIPDIYNVGKFYNSVPLNSPIFFGRTPFGKSIYLLKGWSEWSENWGTWTDGYKAKLSIPIVPYAKKACFLFDAFGASPQSPLELNLFINGGESLNLLLKQSNDNNLCLDIQLFTSDDKFVVEFEFLRLQSPKQMGLSSDSRLLGIGIRQIIFE